MTEETYVEVSGRSREKAQEVLAAARAVGVDTKLVRTTLQGYSVPEEVAQYLEGTWKAPEEKKPARKRTKKSEDNPADAAETENKE